MVAISRVSGIGARRRWLRSLVPIVLVVLAGLLPAAARPAPGDIGYEDGSFSGTSEPTGSKRAESALWWNDGAWWANMWDSTSGDFHIFRLDRGTQRWTDTGVRLDTRASTSADTLWDGQHLYVASHRRSSTVTSGYPSYLYRLSYDPVLKRYSMDPGFPVRINNYRTETLVIDKDSTGKLWATWQQDSKIYVNRTLGNDATWGAPFQLPVAASDVAPDDGSSVIAFDGNKIGIMWSNQTSANDAMWFAVHVDGQPDNAWEASRTAIQGPGTADDHINLKTIQADSHGRVYAAVKTSQTGSAPLILLLVRDPATGDWAKYTFGRGTDCHNRPIVVIDEENRKLHMFATGPQAPGYKCTGQGAIYEKVTSLDNIAFAPGYGTPVIQDADTPASHDVTASKQSVTSATGLVVLAINKTTNRYWHHFDPLTPAAPPPPPVASFTGSPTSGTAPLTVTFTDASSGNPTSWSWSFGDGGTASAQNPSHTYAAPGRYTVSLTATNASGSDTETKTDYVVVTGMATSVTIAPDADAHVTTYNTSKNYGALTTLRVREDATTTTYRSYLKFTVSGVTSVRSAKLRLYVTDPSPDGGQVYPVANTWTETGITWNNAPPISGASLASAGGVALDAWVELDVSAAVTGDGTFSFALKNANTNSAIYSSREGAHPPELVLTLGP